jgi:peptide-methionine (S)-S-oxide reductase
MQVIFDPTATTYRRLLEAFAEQTDMTTKNRQGSDRGSQYRSGVYYHTEAQKEEAEKFIKELNEELASGKSRRGWAERQVMSELKEAGDYYVAEKYHQQYLAKGGRLGTPQTAEKGATDKIRCYG